MPWSGENRKKQLVHTLLIYRDRLWAVFSGQVQLARHGILLTERQKLTYAQKLDRIGFCQVFWGFLELYLSHADSARPDSGALRQNREDLGMTPAHPLIVYNLEGH
jgi:hypothetical protein